MSRQPESFETETSVDRLGSCGTLQDGIKHLRDAEMEQEEELEKELRMLEVGH